MAETTGFEPAPRDLESLWTPCPHPYNFAAIIGFEPIRQDSKSCMLPVTSYRYIILFIHSKYLI